jgi:hypothetical protein
VVASSSDRSFARCSGRRRRGPNAANRSWLVASLIRPMARSTRHRTRTSAGVKTPNTTIHTWRTALHLVSAARSVIVQNLWPVSLVWRSSALKSAVAYWSAQGICSGPPASTNYHPEASTRWQYIFRRPADVSTSSTALKRPGMAAHRQIGLGSIPCALHPQLARQLSPDA